MKGIRYIRCTVEEDDNFEGLGLRPGIFKNWSNFSPALCGAHDLLEHGNKETGCFDEELAAHGGFMFVKNFSTVFPDLTNTPEKLLSGGMTQQYTESTTLGIRTPPKFYGLNTEDIKDIESFCEGYRDGLIEDWESEADNLMNLQDDDGETIPCPFVDDEVWSRCLGWIKYGFGRTKRRFDGDKASAFVLHERLDKVIKDTKKELSYEGQMFTIKIDYRNCWAEIEEHYG